MSSPEWQLWVSRDFWKNGMAYQSIPPEVDIVPRHGVRMPQNLHLAGSLDQEAPVDPLSLASSLWGRSYSCRKPVWGCGEWRDIPTQLPTLCGPKLFPLKNFALGAGTSDLLVTGGISFRLPGQPGLLSLLALLVPSSVSDFQTAPTKVNRVLAAGWVLMPLCPTELLPFSRPRSSRPFAHAFVHTHSLIP